MSRVRIYDLAKELKPEANLSPAFLSEAVGKLDAVFGSLNAENRGERYQDVTGNLALSDGMAVSD